MINRAFVLLLFVLGASALFSSPAYAGWPTNTATCTAAGGQGTCPYSTASVGDFQTACQSIINNPAYATSGTAWYYQYFAGSYMYYCGWHTGYWWYVTFGGTPTCASGSTFNSTTGSCDVVCTSGTTSSSGTWNLGYNQYAWNSPFNATDSSGNVISVCATCAAPSTACYNGCTVSYQQTGSAQITDAYGTVNYSTGNLVQSGASCTSGNVVMSPIAPASTVQQAISNDTAANSAVVAASAAAAVSTAAQQAAIDAGASTAAAQQMAQQAAANAAAQAVANQGAANPMTAFCQQDPNALACQNVNNGVTVGDPVPPDVSTMSTLNSTFSGLSGWQLPAHTSTCPAPVVDLSIIGLHSYTIDAQCNLANQYMPALRAVMAVLFTVIALFIVLSA